ncbi:16S rRNA (cytidine(1402)-2'-O)-methyltransferase [Aliifodinibius salipaludis]|uniref:Ribosomal RNA small subunit methyltransferase I n=1 Tax=Fodinibius salipaludis TaxID=2032627 RepID=A0A2A2GEF5_9BACT|nr:16S rRNA (cytidine(1402)-2'-O)-methyltransferase [Aliifodinibius salipaludis]PAU95748.1 16S rRNA (cytidine(1402)-2'-O)-methyltransferase [Aliifodinibius salipaludis]
MSTLYIIATPIGNLEDISERAIKTLKSVSYIACEDTRTSGVLLKKLDINANTFAFHAHNEHQKVEHLLNILDARQNVAIISDAGMPGISDPGFLAVRAAHKAGHSVSVIPGPDAATTALVASGLPCDKYVFEGFLPQKKGRQKQLKQLVDEGRSIVLYESPHRLMKLLEELRKYMGDQRMMAVCRELTKKFEEVVRGSIKSVYDTFQLRDDIKGEIVVIIAPKDYSE